MTKGSKAPKGVKKPSMPVVKGGGKNSMVHGSMKGGKKGY